MAQRDYTITFRSLADDDPVSTSFNFDGTNSDIAQQLYIRHKAGDSSIAVLINSIPTAVTDRLDPFKIAFNELPGLAQRAILWDTGFGLSPWGDPVQIWPIKDYTMADIAVPQDDLTKVNCTLLECPQPNNVSAFSSQFCSGTQILNVSRCVADTFVDSSASDFIGVMWSTGGDISMTPHIRLKEHTWTEPSTGLSSSIYAVHTVSSVDDPTWNKCPANDIYSSLIVPCHRRIDFTDAQIAAFKRPTGSVWVTTWLNDEFAVKDSGFDELLLLPIVLGVIAVIGIGWLCWMRITGKQTSSYDVDAISSNYLDVAAQEQALGLSSSGPSVSSHPDDYESAGFNQTFRILLHSQHLHGNRLPYDSLVFHTQLSKGVSGEVWVCLYGGQQVAVKKLLDTKNQRADELQAFAQEIELTASLIHPHIVKFVGVAWNKLSNLAMVLECVPMGNLKDYLHKNSDLLSWTRDRVHMMIAVAEALEYLHSRTPAVIHRHLKSNNILLTESFEPKLIDFGESRDMIDLTGVGTPYWTAPEILEGNRYTEKADIYSFGVVLSELDTGRMPYVDAVQEDGTKLMPFQILQKIMSGILRPTFSKDCPPRIQQIGSACLSLDPADRPTAQELIRWFEGRGGEKHCNST